MCLVQSGMQRGVRRCDRAEQVPKECKGESWRVLQGKLWQQVDGLGFVFENEYGTVMRRAVE